MKQLGHQRQRGVSMLGVLFVGGVLVVCGLVGAQAFPTYIEFQAVQAAVKKIGGGSSVAEIRANFDKSAQIDDIKSITGKDLDIAKAGDKFVVKFSYNKEIHLAGPAYFMLKYAGSSQ